jgi:hypothetical protein
VKNTRGLGRLPNKTKQQKKSKKKKAKETSIWEKRNEGEAKPAAHQARAMKSVG